MGLEKALDGGLVGSWYWYPKMYFVGSGKGRRTGLSGLHIRMFYYGIGLIDVWANNKLI